MALVNKINKKVSLKNKKLSQAIEESRYNNKYFENKETLLKSISLQRDYYSAYN
ncbi:unnamed protein product [marine sediment metagenome]|uniref:Uncharacterized protein n=1 Tax=marine sediment metagenome TaxID=412755 RepID=X1D7N3_9ZZZZ